ncbi:hypothetical protein CR513_29264, partial [Mucuna pruriens]
MRTRSRTAPGSKTRSKWNRKAARSMRRDGVSWQHGGRENGTGHHTREAHLNRHQPGFRLEAPTKEREGQSSQGSPPSHKGRGPPLTQFNSMLKPGQQRPMLACHRRYTSQRNAGVSITLGKAQEGRLECPKTYTEPLPHLREPKSAEIVPLGPLIPSHPRSHGPNSRCDNHAGATGHTTERCSSLKIQGPRSSRWQIAQIPRSRAERAE